MAELFPNVREHGRRLIAAGVLAAIALAGSGCSGANKETYKFEVGVVCPDPSDKVDIKKIENKHGNYTETKTVEIVCGKAEAPQAMELIAGDGGATIDDSTDFNTIVLIKAVGPETSPLMVSTHIDQEAGNGRIDMNNIWNVTSAETTRQAKIAPNQ